MFDFVSQSVTLVNVTTLVVICLLGDDLPSVQDGIDIMDGDAVDLDTVKIFADLARNLPYLLLLGIASTPLPRKLFYRFYEKKPSFRTVAAVFLMRGAR